MIDPHLQGWNPLGAQQQASGLRRFIPVLGAWRAAGLYGGVAIGVVGLFQIALSPPHRPSDVIGGFFGGIIAAEQDAAREATVATQKRIADNAAEAQAKGQEQVIVAQTSQQYGLLTAIPSIFGSWWFSGKCIVGMESRDPAARADCHKAQAFSTAVNQQPLNSAYGVGPTSMFGNAPQGSAPIPAAAADAAPLSQGEYNRMARLEAYLSADAVARAQAQVDRSTNRGERRYLGKLAAMAGEAGDDNGPSDQPRVIYTGPTPRAAPPPNSVLNR